MKKIFAILFFLLLFGTTEGFSQATASFTASVTIIEPIEITTTSNMNFASIDAKNGGAVILNPDNTRSTIGTVELADGAGVSAATFQVKGQRGYTYNISLPEGPHLLTNGTENIVLKDFTQSVGSADLADGSQVIRVGATLEVKGKQTPGLYTSPAPIQVTVNYN